MADFRTRLAQVQGQAPVAAAPVAAPVAPLGAVAQPAIVAGPVAPVAPIAPVAVAPTPVSTVAAQPAPVQHAQAPVGAPLPPAPVAMPQQAVASAPTQAVVGQVQPAAAASGAASAALKAPRAPTMSSVIRAKVLEGKDNNTATAEARAYFNTPADSKLGFGMANWHRNDLRKKGLLPAELDHQNSTRRSGGGLRNMNKIKAWKAFHAEVARDNAALAAELGNYIAQKEAALAAQAQAPIPGATYIGAPTAVQAPSAPMTAVQQIAANPNVQGVYPTGTITGQQM